MSPRILLIDSYDSFTYNLAALCRKAIPGCSIHIIKNDAIPFTTLSKLLPHFSAIIVGPGPGSPSNIADIGVVRDIWKLSSSSLLPVFGVCLGLQSLVLEFGGTLKRLNVIKHGQISNIQHGNTGIYKNVGEVYAVRYHSLHVVLNGDEPLQALAWADDGKEENGKVLMAVKHMSKPFWAVQYHPESVRTEGGGEDVVRNWWRLVGVWSAMNGREVQPWRSEVEEVVGPAWPHIHPSLITSQPSSPTSEYTRVSTRVIEALDLDIPTVCESLGVEEDSKNFVMLESAAQPGRFTIIGCLCASSPRIMYRRGEEKVCITMGAEETWFDVDGSIWTWLENYMRDKKAFGGENSIPFWGGLIGFLSYELGVHSLSPSLTRNSERSGEHHDINLAFVERSIVMDSTTGRTFVQSTLPDDEGWLSDTETQLQRLATLSATEERSVPTASKRRRTVESSTSPTVILPNREDYIDGIKRAQEFLYSGDSYELCLTAPTRVRVPSEQQTSGSSSWQLYRTLRQRNPAPHSAYLRLHPSTIVCSSPERFLSFSRPPQGMCQLRPIKGTVRKGPGITRAVAEEALIGSVKEVAENLMIVDLIRHDLHSVVGDDVEVKQFCAVEEYETVWQLVSVIEGRLPQDAELDNGNNLGWQVLRHSLPPGSMTGAPKKRSVEILHGLEGQDRGVYSGVFGYWCVGGGSDWSVTIRSCFKYESKGEEEVAEWTLGAGGAITALSDPESEWEEMLAKVESVLPAFGVGHDRRG
ncbi:para-aminobenzoate synthase [Irpex rosettiformis]|uniref:Para-aminobenzoate synthase n=1 Tax=Irpex rosettiformis TaxID=378272 RepID=A0ACB8UKW1_9APHY|nr:para-aminobenzoate synthase [Irpex rosettiformis]